MIGLAVAYAGLLVSVATLLWRVWRLEYRAKDIEDNAKWLRECVAARAHQSSLLALSERVAGDLDAVKQLARALGYEWKSTPAKSGWERKAISLGHSLHGHAYQVQYMPVREYDWTLPTTNRRKADRRKPAPEIKVKQFCDSCDEKAVKRAKAQLEREINRPAKKRRAH